jgi:hypothetical protein
MVGTGVVKQLNDVFKSDAAVDKQATLGKIVQPDYSYRPNHRLSID